jgi:hypothetical protein
MKTLGAPIALVVTFGPTTNLVAPSKVSQVINYYFGTIPVASDTGFRGTISNVDLSGDADIKQTPQLHRNVCFWGKADIVWKCGRKCGPIGSLLALCAGGVVLVCPFTTQTDALTQTGHFGAYASLDRPHF